MSDQEGLAEVVFLFDEDGTSIESEMRYAEFEALLGETGKLDRFAASVIKAAYALVGAGLAVRGLVFFTFTVDEDGRIDSTFNLPLKYLIENAGQGPDLSMGPIRLASRSQCPVPWHAVNLWEPQGSGDENSAMLVQKAVWRNKLSLKAAGAGRPMEAAIELIPSGEETIPSGQDMVPPGEEQRVLENRLTETFGEEGKVGVQHLIHQQNEQMTKISQKHRSDLERQQQTYLDQIRGCRDEIQKLKSLLRQEQERSRRLQELLRGDV